MNFDQDTFNRAAIPLRKLPAGHVKRDGLVSMMLQDRTILRLISAPEGFGKTMLAREYAQRLFADQDVAMLDASSPDFLLALDREGPSSAIDDEERKASEICVKLIILDNVPWLHEQRALCAAQWIDDLLFQGIEVIVTTRPSCDCLSALLPDRLLLRAVDLLATERECAPTQVGEHDGDALAFGRKRWSEAGKALFGHVPAVLWQTAGNAQLDCLARLFGESIPLSLIFSMCAMLLLESGNVRELEGLGITLRPDELSMLAYDYPLFGLDIVSGDFEVAKYELADLRRAILENKLESSIFEGTHPLPERVAGALFRRGDHQRGSSVVEAFCNDERCGHWLMEHGWDFLDCGELSLISGLLRRCPEEMYASSMLLQALHGWLAGLLGDRREACHIAQRVLQDAEAADKPDRASVAARIALAQFDEDALESKVDVSLSAQEGPSDALGFLALVLDICTDVEIACTFNLESLDDDIRFEKARRFPGKQRVRQMKAIFSGHAEAYGETRCFRLALHLLAHVDSPDLRQLVQDLGCDAILRMRRKGVTTFTEALLVRDMWKTGYFGMTAPVVDRRDAKVLDGAAHMLTLLSTYCGKESADIPWEVHGASNVSPRRQLRLQPLAPGVEEMYVRLFGGFEISIGDRHLTESGWRKKTRALFALLVLNNGRDVPRDEIFAQLWPSISRVHAMDNFYTIWGNCVSSLGEAPYLERNGEYCRIDPRFVRSDVAEFEQLTRHLLTSDHDSKYLLDTYAKIEVLYRGSLLPSEKNVRMINAQRDRFSALFVDAMVAATECALRANDTHIALWFARKAAEEDQGREDVYRALMKAQIAAGQRCPAIRTYLACREYLQNALGLDPSIETRELYSALVTTDPELLRLEMTLSPGSDLAAE